MSGMVVRLHGRTQFRYEIVSGLQIPNFNGFLRIKACASELGSVSIEPT